jgi:hypothetical protein
MPLPEEHIFDRIVGRIADELSSLRCEWTASMRIAVKRHLEAEAALRTALVAILGDRRERLDGTYNHLVDCIEAEMQARRAFAQPAIDHDD